MKIAEKREKLPFFDMWRWNFKDFLKWKSDIFFTINIFTFFCDTQYHFWGIIFGKTRPDFIFGWHVTILLKIWKLKISGQFEALGHSHMTKYCFYQPKGLFPLMYTNIFGPMPHFLEISKVFTFRLKCPPPPHHKK